MQGCGKPPKKDGEGEEAGEDEADALEEQRLEQERVEQERSEKLRLKKVRVGTIPPHQPHGLALTHSPTHSLFPSATNL